MPYARRFKNYIHTHRHIYISVHTHKRLIEFLRIARSFYARRYRSHSCYASPFYSGQSLEADFRRSSLSPLTNERVQNLILLLLAPDDGPSFCQASLCDRNLRFLHEFLLFKPGTERLRERERGFWLSTIRFYHIWEKENFISFRLEIKKKIHGKIWHSPLLRKMKKDDRSCFYFLNRRIVGRNSSEKNGYIASVYYVPF